MIFSNFLVQADISFLIIMSQYWSHSAKEDGHSLVTTCEAMIKIGKGCEVFAVLFKRFQSAARVFTAVGSRAACVHGFVTDSVRLAEALSQCCHRRDGLTAFRL